MPDPSSARGSSQFTMAQCPSCGQFAGPYASCPHCGAHLTRRLPIRLFRLGSLILSLVGVVILFVASSGFDVSTIQIESLAGTMNWAHVRLDGVVSRSPTYDPESRSLDFWLDDGTGELMVVVNDARTFRSRSVVPLLGDRVVAEGTLRVKDEFSYLVVSSVGDLAIDRPVPLPMTVDELVHAPAYQPVILQGVVRSQREPYPALSILSVRQVSGEIDVALWHGLEALGGAYPDLRIGQTVQITGVVDSYQSEPQVAVSWGSDVGLCPEAISIGRPCRIEDLGRDDLDLWVEIEGEVVQVETFSAGQRYTVSDGSGKVTLVLWQDLIQQMPPSEQLDPGCLVHVVGRVAEYRGDLEVIPQIPSDIRIVEHAIMPAPSRILATPRVAIASSNPTRTPVSTREPVSTVPSAEYSPTPTRRLTRTPTSTWVAPTLTATDPIPTVAVTPSPTAELCRSIGSLSSQDVGTGVCLDHVAVTQVDFFSRGVKYTLTDGTGSIILLLWQNVMEEIPGRYDLIAGSQVWVRGQIEEYESELEIIPERGSDLIVLSVGERLPIENRGCDRISASDEGRFFGVEGRITRVEARGWLKLWLHDGAGEIVVFVPERTVPYLPPDLGVGVTVRVTGEIDIYQGVLEIIPLAGADVEVP